MFPKKRLLIFSTIEEDWGGSEELWAKSIPHLLEKGYEVFVAKLKLNEHEPNFTRLKNLGVHLYQINRMRGKTERRIKKIISALRYPFYKMVNPNAKPSHPVYKMLARVTPDFIVLAQGINFDGLHHCMAFKKFNIPYITISQKAVDFFWPEKNARPVMRELLLQSKCNFFVSKHNWQLTEEQFGIRFPNARLVQNPIKITEPIPFPSITKEINIACIGRLFVLDKGQDILFKILSKEKWKQRAINISMYGTGVDETALKDLAALLDLKSITFRGFTTSVGDIWQTHHALILPSRSEGLSLAMIEAMSAGRVVIASNAGGAGEVLQHGVTGFIGDATIHAFDAIMEEAWEKRAEWEDIGKKAASYVHSNLIFNPEQEFAEQIHQLASIETKSKHTDSNS